MESQTSGNVSGILSVGLDPVCIGNAHGGRREDDAFDTVVGELMIERITETPGLISADEFHFFRIFPAYLLRIFQYKPVVGGCRLPVFDLIPVKKEIKAEVSGLYIVGVKGIRGNLDAPVKKKKGFFARFKKSAEEAQAAQNETKKSKKNKKK